MWRSQSSPDAVLCARDIEFAHPARPDGRAFELRVPALDVRRGEVLGLCGPSGSGKSTLLLVLAGLLHPSAGEVLLCTEEGSASLYQCPPSEWRRQRRHFGFVHQDPRESLNDRRTVADIVADPLVIHGLPGEAVAPASTLLGRLADRLVGRRLRREQRARALAMLRKVGITPTQAERGPGELSGGQRQRVALARALVTRPRLVFLDEPTSALDVSVQASIVELLQGLRREESQTAYVLVTHDMPLARQLTDRVFVLDHGRIVESGESERVFAQPESQLAREFLGLTGLERPTMQS